MGFFATTLYIVRLLLWKSNVKRTKNTRNRLKCGFSWLIFFYCFSVLCVLLCQRIMLENKSFVIYYDNWLILIKWITLVIQTFPNRSSLFVYFLLPIFKILIESMCQNVIIFHNIKHFEIAEIKGLQFERDHLIFFNPIRRSQYRVFLFFADWNLPNWC